MEYQRIGVEDYYAQQLFETEELVGYLKSMIDANKSVHEQVIYQSGTERTFAEQLEMNEAIKVYAKLPGWFRVPTPVVSKNTNELKTGGASGITSIRRRVPYGTRLAASGETA